MSFIRKAVLFLYFNKLINRVFFFNNRPTWYDILILDFNYDFKLYVSSFRLTQIYNFRISIFVKCSFHCADQM